MDAWKRGWWLPSLCAINSEHAAIMFRSWLEKVIVANRCAQPTTTTMSGLARLINAVGQSLNFSRQLRPEGALASGGEDAPRQIGTGGRALSWYFPQEAWMCGRGLQRRFFAAVLTTLIALLATSTFFCSPGSMPISGSPSRRFMARPAS